MFSIYFKLYLHLIKGNELFYSWDKDLQELIKRVLQNERMQFLCTFIKDGLSS